MRAGDEHGRVLQTSGASTHPCPTDIGFVGGARMRMGGWRGAGSLCQRGGPRLVERQSVAAPLGLWFPEGVL
ncbi:hypothetical protein GCM10010390_92730 [Streptomyces mordarskii]|uniref:Uncharacterized protein n=1 Tax=Streptomyces mordarskii TaxID=1226758 RepID=A0ABN1EV38_9ACTN